MIRSKPVESLSKQMKRKAKKPIIKEKKLEGDFTYIISTGSTLLNLAISANRIRGGGLCGGVFVEIAGPSQSGKTALLCEIAGEIERQGGDRQFHDPEARIDKEFASLFGMNIEGKNYYRPDTVTELFKNIRAWEPFDHSKNRGIHGIFGDSLAALSTELEMDNDDGDKMGMRRPKEFSEQLRKTCRMIKKNNYLMVCSNQVRTNVDAGKYGKKFSASGGLAISFYASVRINFSSPEKIYKVIKVAGKEKKKVIGIEVDLEVIKTVDDPYRKAKIYIIYGYGIDDIRGNLQYIKDNTKNTTFTVGGVSVGQSMEEAIAFVENNDLVNELKEEVIDLWEYIDSKFKVERKPKR